MVDYSHVLWNTAVCAGTAGSMCQPAVGALWEDVLEELGLAG